MTRRATAEPDVYDNPDEERYEIELDGVVAGFTVYYVEQGRFVFPHTIIEPQFEGHGLGQRLIRGALDDMRARGEKIVPLCAFVSAFIRKHPESADLVGS